MAAKKFMFVLIMILTFCQMLYAHGVSHTVVHEKAVVVRALYHSGEPLAYAAVKIFSPESGEVEFQNGSTDRKGAFSFFPDMPGEWTVKADDGMGHGFTARVNVDSIKEIPVESGGLSLIHKLIIAASVVWGFAGFYFYFRARG